MSLSGGLQPCSKQEIELLEIGFGTGLNVSSPAQAEEQEKGSLHAIERYRSDLTAKN